MNNPENTYQSDGINYIAKEVTDIDDCNGCAFNYTEINEAVNCWKAGVCSPKEREDGRSIIWVKQE